MLSYTLVGLKFYVTFIDQQIFQQNVYFSQLLPPVFIERGLKSVEFSGELQSKTHALLEEKFKYDHGFFNIYRWIIYMWIVIYALRKTADLKHIKQRVSVSLTRSLFVSE